MKDSIFLIILIALVISSRYFFFETENSFNSIDAVYFHQAVKDYSLIDERPHLPGYFLYVKSISLINIFINDIHTSTKSLSICFTFLSSIFLFKSFRKFYNSEVSFVTSAFILFLPVVLFYSSISENYIADFFFSILIFYIGNSKKYSVLIPIILAISTGFRQTSGILLFPLSAYLVGINLKDKHISLKYLMLTLFTSVLIFLFWFIPMTENVGGFSKYLHLWQTHNPTINKGIAKNFVGFVSNMIFVFLPILILIGFLLYNKTLKKISLIHWDRNLLIQLFLWCLPSLIVFSTYHYAKGYILICIVGLYFLVAKFCEEKLVTYSQIISLTILLVIFYFFCPTIEKQVKLNFKNQTISLKKSDKFTQRLLSSYLTVYDNIKINNKRTNSLTNIFNGLSESNSLFADPSLDFRPELINSLFPDKKLYSFGFNTSKKLIYYFELYKAETELNIEIINNSLIIGNKKFVEKYLKNDVQIIGVFGEFAVYSIINSNNVIEKYLYFFESI